MPSGRPPMAETFLWVELRAFCHPTEQEDRVRAAIEKTAPGAAVVTAQAETHFGLPLLILTARLTEAAPKKAFWHRLKGAPGMNEAIASIKDHVDDNCVLHLRLDKQRALQGEFVIVDHDDVVSVRAKVASFPAKRNEAARRATAYLAGL